METHLYSKRKCLLFSCTVCQRTFVCLFYYCLSNSFLFIEHSSMSVKCFGFFFFLPERAKSFCMLKRDQSSMYWAIEKSKQTSTNSSALENIHVIKVPTVCQGCTFFCVCFTRAIPTFVFTHG